VSAPPYDTLNLGLGCGDRRQDVLENRARLSRALGFPRVLFPHQVHGCGIVRVKGPRAEPGEADALIVDRPRILVGVLGADCPGVLLVAPQRCALAVVHAGWRGVAARVVPATVARLAREHGVRPSELRAAIGPGISAARYEVEDDVAAQVLRAVPESPARAALTAPTRPGHATLDLVEALRLQLLGCGLPAESVERHGACTAGEARFFSHRRDHGRTGRHALVAGFL
jgi:YfiH family protein